MGPFLVGELEKDLFAFRVLEPFAVAFEELVRPAFAADADQQRLLVIDALAQLLGAFREQPARRAFEEQERRSGFELRILRAQFLVTLLQRRQMFLLFFAELL